jgi:hypothetical protein
VSDKSPDTSCEDWLATSPTARNNYLLEHWPHLNQTQLIRVVHDQNLSCEVAPPPRRAGHHAAMDDLQPAVDIVVYGLAIFYEETLAVGIKESVVAFLRRVSGKDVPPPG